jgi:phosphoglucosamine mutase
MNVGGEPSGHVILSDFSTTGDGLITALQVLAVVASEDRKVSEVCRGYAPFPQMLQNVSASAATLADARVKAAIASGEQRFGKRGRLVIRPSGTEPVVRVMGEAEDAALVKSVVGDIVEAIREAAR